VPMLTGLITTLEWLPKPTVLEDLKLALFVILPVSALADSVLYC
jgi:hypothetical protein